MAIAYFDGTVKHFDRYYLLAWAALVKDTSFRKGGFTTIAKEGKEEYHVKIKDVEFRGLEAAMELLRAHFPADEAHTVIGDSNAAIAEGRQKYRESPVTFEKVNRKLNKDAHKLADQYAWSEHTKPRKVKRQVRHDLVGLLEWVQTKPGEWTRQYKGMRFDSNTH